MNMKTNLILNKNLLIMQQCCLAYFFTVFIDGGSEDRLIYTFVTLSGNNTLSPPPSFPLPFLTYRDVRGGSQS